MGALTFITRDNSDQENEEDVINEELAVEVIQSIRPEQSAADTVMGRPVGGQAGFKGIGNMLRPRPDAYKAPNMSLSQRQEILSTGGMAAADGNHGRNVVRAGGGQEKLQIDQYQLAAWDAARPNQEHARTDSLMVPDAQTWRKPQQ